MISVPVLYKTATSTPRITQRAGAAYGTSQGRRHKRRRRCRQDLDTTTSSSSCTAGSTSGRLYFRRCAVNPLRTSNWGL